MIGDAVLYAARATSTAIDNVSRWAVWTVAASAFLLCALVSALILVYQLAEPKVGTVAAVALISAGCLLIGLVCLSLPGLIERAQHRRAQTDINAGPVAAAVAAAAGEETKRSVALQQTVALQVVAAAFLLGLEAARRLKE
jgi:hypothetical protein